MKGYLTKIIEKNLVDIPEEKRNYIGASSIGSDCMRQVWYEFNGFEGEPFTQKTKRIFQTGKNLESMIIDILNNCGLNVVDSWWDLKDSELPYFRGHVDAVWCDDDGVGQHIIEIKTAKDSSFKQFIKDGVKKWSPRYYAQIQSYMGMSGIYSSYILVLNKDNSDLFDEKISFDPDYYEQLKLKARMIHDSKTEPPKVSSSPSWYLCKMCKFRKVCHDTQTK